MLLTKFHIIWPSGFRGKAVLEIDQLRPCLLTDQNGMSNSHRGSFMDASYQVSVYLANLCHSRRFLEIDLSVVAMFVNRLGQN